MSTSTNGQICYGILFEEDFEFPWSTAEFEDDIDEWWQSVNDYTNPHESPYNDGGGRRFPFDDPRTQRYLEHGLQWKQDNPLPIELVNYQSGECPAYILAIPSTFLEANRGYPQIIDLQFFLHHNDRSETYNSLLLDFCSKYGIEIDEQPKWYLSSYWG